MVLSVSRIKTFKSCRRLYQLHYIEKLTPAKESEALRVGKTYHEMLEQLYNGEPIDCELTKELAMVTAYNKYIYPKFTVVEAEKAVEYDLGNGDKLIGRIDGIADDGHIVEHKTCSQTITEQYEYDLLWDEQILAYMLMTGKRKAWYTVCRKPTIRQKQDESESEFFSRMINWYDENTDEKIRLLEVERSDEDIKEYLDSIEVIKATMQEADQTRNYYKNTCHCNMYGRRCEYSAICLNYDPELEYIEFVKG